MNTASLTARPDVLVENEWAPLTSWLRTDGSGWRKVITRTVFAGSSYGLLTSWVRTDGGRRAGFVQDEPGSARLLAPDVRARTEGPWGEDAPWARSGCVLAGTFPDVLVEDGRATLYVLDEDGEGLGGGGSWTSGCGRKGLLDVGRPSEGRATRATGGVPDVLARTEGTLQAGPVLQQNGPGPRGESVRDRTGWSAPS